MDNTEDFFKNYRGQYSQYWIERWGLIPELPTSFDNANSIYELVAWLQRAFKNLLDDFQQLESEFEDFKNALIDLLEYLIPELIRRYSDSEEFRALFIILLEDILAGEERTWVKDLLKELLEVDMREWLNNYVKSLYNVELSTRLGNIEQTMKKKNSKEFDLLEYGLIPNDIAQMAHNNSLFLEILQYQGSLKINVPTNYRFYIGDITCGRGDIDIYGGGSLTINMHFVSENIKSYVHISNVTFEYDSVQPTNLPLQFQRTTRGSIKNCQFKNCHKAISYDSLDSAQHFSRFVIDSNYFLGVDYALYGERQVGGQQPLISADIHFTNNIVEECYITHIHAEGFDGGVISNNTFFFPSYMRRPTEKKYNIYIDYCDWTVISNNNLFEAGLDSIHVEHGQHLNITGNNIAWCGQRLGGSGIKLVNLDNANGRFNISTISNNIIMYPTESGIFLNNVGHIAVDSNNIFGAGNTTYFYGDTSLLGSLEKWGIYLGTTAERITATDNLCSQNAINNLNSSTNIVKNNMTADNSGTTIDVSKRDFIVTVASGNRVGTAGTNISADKILSATIIYSDDVFNNFATPCINPDGSLSVVTSSDASANRSYKVRVNLIN